MYLTCISDHNIYAWFNFPFPQRVSVNQRLEASGTPEFKKLISTKVLKRIFFKLIQYTLKSWEINKHHLKTCNFETNISVVPRKVKDHHFSLWDLHVKIWFYFLPRLQSKTRTVSNAWVPMCKLLLSSIYSSLL